MSIGQSIIVTVASVTALAGIAVLLRPGLLARVEDALNRRVGEQRLLEIRVGVPIEQAAERVLNRPVLERSVYWDRWLAAHPRGLGAVLVAAGAGLAAYALAAMN